jgi:hypothetical protein
MAKTQFLGVLLLAIALVSFLDATLSILMAEAEIRIQYVPDDAFYYLTLARNFGTLGQWTFDSGISVTTGFHYLHAYFLVALHEIFHPETETFVSLAVLSSLLLALVSAIVAAVFAWRTRQLFSFALLSLFLLSRNVWLNAVSAVEWSWVVLISALYCLALFRSQDAARKREWLLLALLGGLGSLARLDYGLLPAAIVAAAFIEHLVYRRSHLMAPSLIGLAGAVTGVTFVFLHNHAICGEWIPSSAGMKYAWLEIYGRSTDPIVDKILLLFARTSGSTPTLVHLLVGLVLAVGIWGYFLQRKAPHRWALRTRVPDVSAHRVLWLASAGAVIGYIQFYANVAVGVQHWYTANLVVPAFLFLVLPFASHQVPAALRGAALVLLAVLGVRQAPSALNFAATPEWPHQVSMIRAGQYLADSQLPMRVGSWNAGIIGFYEGGHVVNLDGLVNQGIQSYVAANDLIAYVDSVGIELIADFEDMLTSPKRMRRGGYADANLPARLLPLMKFDEQQEGWRQLVIYRLLPPSR